MRLVTVITIGVLGCVLFSCGADSQRPPGVNDNLAKTQLALSEVDTGSYQLFVSKSALAEGAPFLLSTSRILTTSGTPQFKGMISRVVIFKHADGEVQMLESPHGSAIDPRIERPNIIASFPILSEADDALGLDFNEGAVTTFTAIEAATAMSAGDTFTERFAGKQLTKHYVDEGRTDARGRITIHQIAQAEVDGEPQTLEQRYFLQPYTPDPSYPARISNQDGRWSGYFTSLPVLTDTSYEPQRYLRRFHPDRHLTFAISDNTPHEVRSAIREGIRYWNRVRDAEWIDVIDAPKGVTAPDLDYNLIQWIPGRGAIDAAYADAQIDPLTGEILNAQVYLPSSFYDDEWSAVASAYARDVIADKLPSLDDAAEAKSRRAPDPESDALDVRELARGGKEMLRLGLTDDVVKRAALDRVRTTVAHELGHVLGLMHNFAGSLGSTIAADEIDGLMADYFASADWPEDKVPGASIMDYRTFEDNMAMGARIRLERSPMAYDVLAIANLYSDVPLHESGPLFCTERDLGRYMDCRQYDAGADVIAAARRNIEHSVQDAAVDYLFGVLAAKQNGSSDLFASTRPERDVAQAYAQRFEVVKMLSDQSYLLQSERAIGSANLNGAEIHADSVQRIASSLAAEGGYSSLFALLPADFDDTFKKHLDDLLGRASYTRGETSDGQRWALEDSEIEQVRAFAPKYLSRYHSAAEVADLLTLLHQDPVALVEKRKEQTLPKWDVPADHGALEAVLAERVSHDVGATRGSFSATIAATDADGNTVQRRVSLPRFAHSVEVRRGAPFILAPDRSVDRAWAFESRQAVATAFLKQLDATGVPFKTLQLDGSDAEAQRWILDNRDVLSAIASTLQN